MKVLFVCRGNHGRSQLAEAIFNHLANGKHIATSAGTKVVTERKNNEGKKITDPNIIEVMKELDIDVSEKTRNQVTSEMLEGVDRIVVMAEPETIPEFLKSSKKAIFWEVLDPFQESLVFTRDLRNRLEILIRDYIQTLD